MAMEPNQLAADEKTFGCETCPIRQKAEANPKRFIAKLWRWHTTWCSGWKEYQAYLSEKEIQVPQSIK
jgi:hypothetical protein